MGVTLAIMEERGKPLLDFFTCLSEGIAATSLNGNGKFWSVIEKMWSKVVQNTPKIK